MYKVIIWGTGRLYNTYFNLIKLYEERGDFEVIGITSNIINIPLYIDGYRFYKKCDIPACDFDYCLVAVNNLETVREEAKRLRIDIGKLIPVRVLEIPYFSFDKYIKLKESNLSIVSSNCWAGLCYHYLGLEFLSPTINMFFNRCDFNKFIQELDYYLSKPVEFARMNYEHNLKKMYPVGKIDDIELHFNHYETFEQANACWERRKIRINKENLFIIQSTESVKIAREFDDLPYENKCCFVSFECDMKSSYTIDCENKDDTVGMICNGIANGNMVDFDILKFLMREGKYIRLE